MLAALGSSIYADWWAKPFGVESNRREFEATERCVPSKFPVGKKYDEPGWTGSGRFLARLRLRKPSGLGVLEPAVTPTVGIKVYAHDRIVISIFDRYEGVHGSHERGLTAKEIIRSDGSLVKRRETRRGFKIGGRLRFRPPVTKFTGHARNMVKDAAHIIETSKKGQGVFWTATIAGGTRKAYACMAAASGYAVDRMNRWLRYRVVDGFFTYVWELQQRGAPHLHYLFSIPDNCDLAAFGRDIQQQWRRILYDIGAESGIDVFARLDGGTWKHEAQYPRCDIRPLSHSYANYVSKYVSKERTKNGESSVFRPGRWWGISYSIRPEIAKRRLSVRLSVPGRSAGHAICETFIGLSAALVTSFKWIKLPFGSTTEALSISFSSGAALAAARAVIELVGCGDYGEFQKRLAVVAGLVNTT